jgi:hypothetical protein
MNELKKFIQERGIKKIGISRFYSNIPLGEFNSNNPKEKHPLYLEIYYLNKWIKEECGITADIIKVTKVRKEYPEFNQVLYSDINLSDYDLIIMQPQSFLLMAGMIRVYTLRFIQKFIKEVKCPVVVLHTDPDYSWTNPFKFFVNRKGTPIKYVNSTREWAAGIRRDIDPTPTQADVDTFDNIETHYLYSGDDWSHWNTHYVRNTNHVEIDKHINAKYFEYMAKNEIERSPIPKISTQDKEYDAIYFGRNRKERMKQMLPFLSTDRISKLLLGKDLPQLPQSTNIDAVPRESMGHWISKAWVSVIAVDKAHENNIITFRYFENIANGVFSVIYLPHNREKKWIRIPEELTYFTTEEELYGIIQYLKSHPEEYESLVNIQRESLMDYLNKSLVYS